MKQLSLALMALIVAVVAACRSSAAVETTPNQLPEVRYYVIGDA